MNIEELYKYVEARTGLRLLHISLADGVTDLTEKEADEFADCIKAAYAREDLSRLK